MNVRRRWVILNYPVVTSRGGDNSGGHEHLLGNLQVYAELGFRVLCLCRLSWPLVDRLAGAVVLNIVPGTAVPVSAPGSKRQNAPTGSLSWKSWLLRAARQAVLLGLFWLLTTILRPAVIHQRANRRFLPPVRCRDSLHLIELNDEYLPTTPCDGYLSVNQRGDLTAPQLAWPWPVPAAGQFELDRFTSRLRRIADGAETLHILLFGAGGVPQAKDVRHFARRHIWFAGKQIILHVYGGETAEPGEDGIMQYGWLDVAALPVDRFHAAIIFYDPSVYDDTRLAMGSPTKLWKYIDWSLPVFTNRVIISDQFLGGFDLDGRVLAETEAAANFGCHLLQLRKTTSVKVYASELGGFLSRSSLPDERSHDRS